MILLYKQVEIINKENYLHGNVKRNAAEIEFTTWAEHYSMPELSRTKRLKPDYLP